MKKIIDTLKCGVIYKHGPETLVLRVSKFKDIQTNIIPLFKEYPILGVRAQDFDDFCKIALIVEYKKHLTKEGFYMIRKIKSGMNTGRSVE